MRKLGIYLQGPAPWPPPLTEDEPSRGFMDNVSGMTILSSRWKRPLNVQCIVWKQLHTEHTSWKFETLGVPQERRCWKVSTREKTQRSFKSIRNLDDGCLCNSRVQPGRQWARFRAQFWKEYFSPEWEGLTIMSESRVQVFQVCQVPMGVCVLCSSCWEAAGGSSPLRWSRSWEKGGRGVWEVCRRVSWGRGVVTSTQDPDWCPWPSRGGAPEMAHSLPDAFARLEET